MAKLVRDTLLWIISCFLLHIQEISGINQTFYISSSFDQTINVQADEYIFFEYSPPSTSRITGFLNVNVTGAGPWVLYTGFGCPDQRYIDLPDSKKYCNSSQQSHNQFSFDNFLLGATFSITSPVGSSLRIKIDFIEPIILATNVMRVIYPSANSITRLKYLVNFPVPAVMSVDINVLAGNAKATIQCINCLSSQAPTCYSYQDRNFQCLVKEQDAFYIDIENKDSNGIFQIIVTSTAFQQLSDRMDLQYNIS